MTADPGSPERPRPAILITRATRLAACDAGLHGHRLLLRLDAVHGATRYDWYFRSPDGESYARAATRLKNWLDGLQEPTIAVTHGLVTRIVRGIRLGLDRTASLSQPILQDGFFHLSSEGVAAIDA